MNKSAARWLLLVLAVLPAFVPLWMILHFGVDGHTWDEWDPYVGGLHIKAHQHQLTVSDLIRQHNEHRILLPRLVFIGLAKLTHWSGKALLLAEWKMVCLTSLGVWWLICRTFPRTSTASDPRESCLSPRVLFLWFLSNLLIFAPDATQNWLWGMGVVNVLPMMFIVAALVAITSSLTIWTRAILGIIAALAATYSSGNGILAWGLAGAMLAWPWSLENWMRKKWVLLAWVVAAIVVVATYFVGYTQPDHRGAPTYATSLWPTIGYVLVFLGLPFAHASEYPEPAIAMTIGSVMLVLLALLCWYFVDVWRRRNDKRLAGRMLLWIVVAGFSALSAMIAAMGRAGAGIMQPFTSPRYVTFGVYLPIALVQLMALVFEDLRIHQNAKLPRALRPAWMMFARAMPTLGAVLATIVVVLQVLTYPHAFAESRAVEQRNLQAKAAVLLVNVLPDNPAIGALVYPDSQVVIKEAPVLSEMGYIRPALISDDNAAKIRETDPQVAASAQGRIDRSSEGPPGQINALGWAIFRAKSAPADAVFITYDDTLVSGTRPMIAFGLIGQPRGDVAQKFGDSDFTNCGWLVQFPRRRLPNDGHGITVRAWALDTDTGRAVELENPITIP